jgi:hypothetical protein
MQRGHGGGGVERELETRSEARSEAQDEAQDGVKVELPSVVDGMEVEVQRWAARAEENGMNRTELQTVLGYLNLGLAIAHSQGVTLGHFGNGDFVGLAETVNGLLLRAITPQVAAPVASAPVAVEAPAAVASGPVSSGPVAA